MTLRVKYIIFTVMSISGFFRRLFSRSAAQELPQAAEPEKPSRPEERFILCLDGGGMRGIIPVVMMMQLEKCIREAGGNEDIAQYFDMISGTSTGGLISLALSCPSSIAREKDRDPQVDLEKLLANYMTMGKDIFQAQSSLFGLRQIVSDKYRSENIQELCQRWFGARTMDCAKVPTLIMAYDLTEGSPRMIRSYGDEASYPVWIAARATSAAPTYFSPVEYDGHLLVDGGVIANNPAVFAYFEARKLYPDCRKFNILSVSTGGAYHTMNKDSTKGLMSWADQVAPMYSTAQKRTADHILVNLPDVDYIRIDDVLSQPVKMDETNPTVLQFIRQEAENNALVHQNKLENYAKALVENMEFRNNASETGRT